MAGHKRTCPEDDCVDWCFVLSTHDKPFGLKNGFPINQRTIKWKCEAGHRSETQYSLVVGVEHNG